ncbi:uncharacterized protein LOC134677241 [Cydia fagiglandana]|uniref:uncharacterized protein LOC134668347 n=1 Tax=Cydia fagiglandana TaxID=1458189 RepID=UPI002FEE640A
METTRSQTPRVPEGKPEGAPTPEGNGAVSAVPGTSTQHNTTRGDGAVPIVPPSSSRAYREEQTTLPSTTTHGAVPTVPTRYTHQMGAVSTVPPQIRHNSPRGGAVSTAPPRKGQPAAGIRAAGKPKARKPATWTPKPVGSVPQRTQALLPTPGTSTGTVPTGGKPPATEQTPVMEPALDPVSAQLEAGWTVQVSRKARRWKPNKRVETPVPPPPPVTAAAKPHKLNKKQRRKRRERLAALNTAPAPQQSVSGKGQAQAAAGPPAANRAPPQEKRAKGTRAKKESNQGARSSAKRARLDETISPRGEPKRQKTGPPGETPHADYAEAAKADLLVAVTTATSGHLTSQQSDEVQRQLLALLSQEARQPTSSLPAGPLFRGKPVWANGSLRLWCENQATLAWLKRSVATITLDEGEKVVVKRQSEVPKRVRCGILFPGVWEDFGEVGRALRYQNPWAEIDRWLLNRREVQGTETFAVVSVPETVVQPLVSRGRRLGFMLGSVYVKFEGSRGKFREQPPPSSTVAIDGAAEAPAEPMDTCVTTQAPVDEVQEPELQAPAQSPSVPEKDEEELLRDSSGSEGECAQGLGKLAIGKEEEEPMSAEEGDPGGGTPFAHW